MPYPYYPYQPNYFQQPMPDQLAQLRQMQQPQQFQPQQNSLIPSIVWVQSEAEAASYPVAPNNAVTLWDSNSPVVYLKQADASGKPSMRIYDLVERNSRPVPSTVTQTVEYATKEELEALSARIDALMATKEPPAKSTSKRIAQKEDAE